MNRLALGLNAAGLAGQWHFAAGTRFDQSSVDIGFDTVEDTELAWRGQMNGGLLQRAVSGGLAPVATAPPFG